MSNKQLTWRCGSEAILSVFLLFSSTYSSSLLGMDSLRTNSQIGMDQFGQKPILDLDASSILWRNFFDDGLVPEMTNEEKLEYICNGNTWEELMDAFKGAPEKARMVAEHLIKSRNPKLRAVFFVGPPGGGKTTTALAIPHIARWYFDFINAGELLSRHRNETKERLEKHFERALSLGKKVVIIIDEINRLLENFNSKKHDSDTTSSYLWTFLDSQKRNENFFLIGTMNRDDKLPEPFKNRKGGTTVYFERFSPEKLRAIFQKKIETPQMELHASCTAKQIDSFIRILEEELINFSPRDYENIQNELSLMPLPVNTANGKMIITMDDLKRALMSLATTYRNSCYGHEELTDEEWRDFNAVQSRIFEVRLQCIHKVQKTVHTPFILPIPTGFDFSSAPNLDFEKAVKILEEEFSPYQIALYKRVMGRSYLLKKP